MIYKDRPLVSPATQYGKTELELLEQFREYEPRTRYRIRIELTNRPIDKVQAAIRQWLPSLKSDPPASSVDFSTSAATGTPNQGVANDSPL